MRLTLFTLVKLYKSGVFE